LSENLIYLHKKTLLELKPHILDKFPKSTNDAIHFLVFISF
jgi:hypothetical protein